LSFQCSFFLLSSSYFLEVEKKKYSRGCATVAVKRSYYHLEMAKLNHPQPYLEGTTIKNAYTDYIIT